MEDAEACQGLISRSNACVMLRPQDSHRRAQSTKALCKMPRHVGSRVGTLRYIPLFQILTCDIWYFHVYATICETRSGPALKRIMIVYRYSHLKSRFKSGAIAIPILTTDIGARQRIRRSSVLSSGYSASCPSCSGSLRNSRKLTYWRARCLPARSRPPS